MVKRISSTLIWLQNDDQRGLLYFDNLELKWWSKGSPLHRSGFGVMIKRISSTLIIWNWIDDQRDLLYFDNLELKWWSRGFPLPQSGFGMMIKGISSTSIWLWDDDQRDLLYLDLDFFSTKSQNFKLDFNWQVLHGRTVFEMCDFHLLTLDLNFVKKSLINIRFFFWETFDLWNLEVLKFLFQILRLWN